MHHPRYTAPFYPRTLPIATLIATLYAPVTSLAQSTHDQERSVELAPVVVTANPLGSSLFDLVAPVSVVGRQEISERSASTLGETLSDTPGISTSNFGPNASRPVIRGLDADRVKIMQNGVGMLDLSALSPDHATPIDPLVIDQIEVVRGPAALLYGGSAIGGVVNAIDNRIPQDALTGISGRGEFRHGGADKQDSSSAVLEVGNGRFALHADGFNRSSKDLVIPGYARSARRRAQSPQADEAQGRLPNSSGQSDGAALGASLTFDSGFAGLSHSAYNSDYGTVAEANVRIRMESERWDFASEARDLGSVISKVKVRFAHTDYQHKELNNGAIATTFGAAGNEGQIEATHAKLGRMSGVIGFQFNQADINVQGSEALLPNIQTQSRAAYLYEELPFDKLKFTFGGRLESVDISSAGGGPDDPNNPGTPRFGAAEKRSFNPHSAAAGALYNLSDSLALATNLSHAERAPSYNELFANGPHAATGQYEVGSKQLKVEKSNGLDLQLRWKNTFHSGKVSAFHTRFQNYITLFGTGNKRDEDGTINPAGELPEAQMRAVAARFTGMEFEDKLHVYEGIGDLDLKLKADTVRASNADTGEPLPRIAPYHLGFSLDYRLGAFNAKLDTTYAGKQTRVANNELPTDSYTMVNALISYRLPNKALSTEVFLRANNLLNEEARLHTSVLKDMAPLGGRSAMIGVRASF